MQNMSASASGPSMIISVLRNEQTYRRKWSSFPFVVSSTAGNGGVCSFDVVQSMLAVVIFDIEQEKRLRGTSPVDE